MKTYKPLFILVFATSFGAMVAIAAPPGLSSSRVVSLAGIAEGLPAGANTTPEVVDLTGQARITTTSIPSDTTTPDAIAPPSVVVDIEILNAKGKGRTTKQPYQSRGLDRSILTMPLNPIVTAEADVLIFPVSHASLADLSKVSYTPAHMAFTLNMGTDGAFKGVAASPLATPLSTNFQ